MNCFAGGAVVEAGGSVVAHGRQLQAITLLFQAVEKTAHVLPLSSVLLLFFCCISFSLYSGLGDVSFQDPTSSAPLFLFLTLTVHSPLPLTVPLGRFFLFPFGSFSLSSNPPVPLMFMAFPVFFPSLVRFPLFSSCRSLFSFVNSLCLSLFFSPSLLLACWRCGGVFIGQKGAGASLLLPYSSAWGAGLCCPATAPGWQANGWGWHGAAPLVFPS